MMALHVRAAAGFAIGALLVTTAFLACSKDSEGGSGTNPAATEPEPLFRAIEADLKTTCGGVNGGCHIRGSQAPHWLGDPDAYVSVK